MSVYQAVQQDKQMVVAVDVGQWLRDTAVGIGGDVGESLVTPLLDLIHQAGISTTLTFHIPILQLPQEGEATAPLDPVTVVDNIARAVSQAEHDLNQQNMVVSAGTIETYLTVHQGNGEIAQSKISIAISPKSHT